MNERKPRVLLADDDAAFRLAMGKALGRLGFPVEEARSGREAVEALLSGRSDVALLDLQLGDMDGLTVLQRSRGTRTRVIVVTGHGTIPAAVEAMRLGAASFVQKPVDAQALAPLLADVADEEISSDLGMAGESPALDRVRSLVRLAADTDETVLVTGESGVGKELVARALHQESARSGGPFVAFNCAQAHNDLFDAELFGHVKGSFTGADRDRPGLFREADRGTLFLDEVGELPDGAQAKLLRALETRTIRSVGGTKEEPVDVRVVAASNRDLGLEVERGHFRSDLLYRLHVLLIDVPPLRDRRQDLPGLTELLLGQIGKSRGRRLTLSSDSLPVLAAYDWPGNVRELTNVLKRAALFSREDILSAESVREAISGSIFGHPEARAARSETTAAGSDVTLAELEKRHVLDTFERMGGNVTRVAQALGIDRRTLQRKLRSLGRDAGED